MKTIKTILNDLICVEVPEDIDLDTFSLSTSTDIHFLTKSGKDVDVYIPQLPDIKILGKLSELSEEECSRFVEYHEYPKYYCYRDYKFLFGTEDYEKEHLYDYFTAKESLISLLQSNGIDIDKELLIIEVL